MTFIRIGFFHHQVTGLHYAEHRFDRKERNQLTLDFSWVVVEVIEFRTTQTGLGVAPVTLVTTFYGRSKLIAGVDEYVITSAVAITIEQK